MAIIINSYDYILVKYSVEYQALHLLPPTLYTALKKHNQEGLSDLITKITELAKTILCFKLYHYRTTQFKG